MGAGQLESAIVSPGARGARAVYEFSHYLYLGLVVELGGRVWEYYERREGGYVVAVRRRGQWAMDNGQVTIKNSNFMIRDSENSTGKEIEGRGNAPGVRIDSNGDPGNTGIPKLKSGRGDGKDGKYERE